ncbi:MAG: hypothetical protein ACFFCW_32940, partial [Candidatus Hodarchaeota archaeon]
MRRLQSKLYVTSMFVVLSAVRASSTTPEFVQSLPPVNAYLLWSLPPGTAHLAHSRGPGIGGR